MKTKGPNRLAKVRWITMVATCGAEAVHFSRAHVFFPGFKWGSCCSIFSFLCIVLYHCLFFCPFSAVNCIVYPFSVGNCIVYPFSIYDFWLPLHYQYILTKNIYIESNMLMQSLSLNSNLYWKIPLFFCPVIENITWFEPLLRGHIS
jgi:hypothetical protein